MDYDFSKLSHTDFESLARDLIGCAIGVRLEAFTEGPDGGIDGRYVTESGAIILQVKHYQRSAFSALKTTMTKERPSMICPLLSGPKSLLFWIMKEFGNG